jgi:peptide/nickel transport system ATP-binding protein
MSLLEIEDLTVEFDTRAGPVRALDGVSLTIEPGEILGMVGESGAGKSLTGMAVLGLLPPNARISGGRISLKGIRIDRQSERLMRGIRGRKIGAVFQDPLTALNPLMTIGDQLIETVRRHLPLGRGEAWQRSVDLLASTGIPAPDRRMRAYPSEFSGGMRQRVVIALALAGDPSVIIADEPTTALDVSVQAQILDLLRSLCRKRGTAILLVTHDMGVISETADRVAVLYAGGVVETGPVGPILANPRHPYTQGLMASIPELGGPVGDLAQIQGSMPRPGNWPGGCRFAQRCAFSDSRCEARPALVAVQPGHHVACIRTEIKQARVIR